MTSVQTVVIGAGVVGLAAARTLARRGHEVVVLEGGSIIGSGTSSRNSEVIHAGIYYAPGSLKAMYCVQGREMMYRFLEEYQIPHNKCGKLIVATSDEELSMLNNIIEGAVGNGVDDLRIITREEVSDMEPECHCTGAIYSPSTGIVDSHSYMQALQGDAEDHGAVVAYNCAVLEGRVFASGTMEGHTELTVCQDGTKDTFACRNVINTAGLYAPAVANRLDGFPRECVPSSYFAKGNYFSLTGKSPFSRLIYPVPLKHTAGLGVHATIDLMGRTKFGPDVEWIETPAGFEDWGAEDSYDCFLHSQSYNIDSSRADLFYSEIRKYFPGLQDDSLVADYSGIRPKISGPNDPARDFCMMQYPDHGVKGHVHFFGIESPGLTASLALAESIDAECLW